MSRHEAWLYPQTLTERLAELPSGSPILRALRNRSDLLDGLESGYRELQDLKGKTRIEALTVTAFAAHLHADQAVAAHFHQLLAAEDAAQAELIRDEAGNAAIPGPYGRFPPGPLSAEDLDGPAWRADPPLRQRFGARLSAALEYAHIVTLHPRDLTGEAEERLQRAGWEAEEILRLNRLLAWIGALSPVVAGLRVYTAARHPYRARSGRLSEFDHG